jgi:hypothetical protein
MSRTAILRGGPFDGAEVEVRERWPHLSTTGDGVPEGHVASYTATRDPNVLKFRGLTKIVGTLALPGRRVA